MWKHFHHEADIGVLGHGSSLEAAFEEAAVALTAVITDPEIVLCDEPFSGLDPLNLRRIESLMVELNRRLGITLIVTSHHLASSLRMADRIAFLVDGKAVVGTPDELLHSQDPRIARFLAAESADRDEDFGPAARAGAEEAS